MARLQTPRANQRYTMGDERRTKPVSEISKAVSYVASGTNSNQILAISGTDSATAVKTAMPSAVVVENNGNIPVVAMLGYESYSDEDTDAGTAYLQALLLPGESIEPPMRAVLPTANHLHVLDGEVVDFTAPNTALKVDTGDDVVSGELNNTTDPVVFELNNGHEKYRVGDYLRVTNEIIKVEGTYDDNPTSTVVPDNHILVSRAHFGSTAASHSGTPDVYWPIFNEHYDFDRALSGSSQLVQTDSLGRYRSCNFFGYGRTDGDSSAFGLVPGSINIRFYQSAFQEVFMGGSGADGGAGVSNILINSSTSSKLATSTAFAFNLTIDDSSATTISFTTDSSNVNFGGTNGIVQKIQDAITTATRTAGNALFGYGCTVSIVKGGLRFTSTSHLIPHDGTNGSKILLADAGSGTNVFSGSAGIFPDVAMVNAPIAAELPPKNVYDQRTYATSPNQTFLCRDDGHGRLVGAASGTINYETGYIDMYSAPMNASMEVSVIHNSPFSGKLDADKADACALTAIHANVLNKFMTGSINVKTY